MVIKLLNIDKDCEDKNIKPRNAEDTHEKYYKHNFVYKYDEDLTLFKDANMLFDDLKKLSSRL